MQQLFIIFIFLLGYVPLCWAQAHVTVWSIEDQAEIRQQTQYYADLFTFDTTVHLLVIFDATLPDKLNGYTLYRDFMGIKQVCIRINRQPNKMRQWLTLAHEMVHARQFVSGELHYVSKNCYIWKEKTYKNIHHIAYHQRAWEREAHAMAGTLYNSYKKQRPVYTLRTP